MPIEPLPSLPICRLGFHIVLHSEYVSTFTPWICCWYKILIAIPALPPNAPQIPWRRRPRHRPPHRLRSHISGFHLRKGLLLHLPDPLLRYPAHLRLQSPPHQHPLPQHCCPTLLRLRPRQVHLSQLPLLPDPIFLPSRLTASLCGPFYSRALRLREAAYRSQRSKDRRRDP